MSKLSLFLLGTTGFVILGFPVLGMDKDPKERKVLGVKKAPPPTPPKNRAPFRATKGKEAPPPAPDLQTAGQLGASVSDQAKNTVSPPVPSRQTNQGLTGRQRGASVSDPSKGKGKKPLPDLPTSTHSSRRTQPSLLEMRRQKLKEAREKIEKGWTVNDEDPEKEGEKPSSIIPKNIFGYSIKGEPGEEISSKIFSNIYRIASNPDTCKSLVEMGTDLMGKVKLLDTAVIGKALSSKYRKKFKNYLIFHQKESDPSKVSEKFKKFTHRFKNKWPALTSLAEGEDLGIGAQVMDKVLPIYAGKTLGEVRAKIRKDSGRESIVNGSVLKYGLVLEDGTILKMPLMDSYSKTTLQPVTFMMTVISSKQVDK